MWNSIKDCYPITDHNGVSREVLCKLKKVEDSDLCFHEVLNIDEGVWCNAYFDDYEMDATMGYYRVYEWCDIPEDNQPTSEEIMVKSIELNKKFVDTLSKEELRELSKKYDNYEVDNDLMM